MSVFLVLGDLLYAPELNRSLRFRAWSFSAEPSQTCHSPRTLYPSFVVMYVVM